MPHGRNCHKRTQPKVALNLRQLTMLDKCHTLIVLVLDFFHLALSRLIQIISQQDFTQVFALMKFQAQRAKFWLVESINIFDNQVVGKGSSANPALSTRLLEGIQDYQAGEDSLALRNHEAVLLDRSTLEVPLNATRARSAQPLLSLQGPPTSPLEQPFMALEGTKFLVQSERSEKSEKSELKSEQLLGAHCRCSIAAHLCTSHNIIGEFEKLQQGANTSELI